MFLEVERCNPKEPATLNRASKLRKVLAYANLRETGAARHWGKSEFKVAFLVGCPDGMGMPSWF